MAAGDGAGDHVGVAGKIFCGAVDDHVEAEFDRFLQHGGGESVVNHRDQVVFLGERDGFPEIDETQGGIGGRFDVERLRAR